MLSTFQARKNSFTTLQDVNMLYTKKNLRQDQARRRYGRNKKIEGAVEAGWSARRVAKKYGISYSWAKKLVRRLKAGGSAERIPGSGRKRKTSVREDRYLVRRAKLERPPDEDCPRASDLADELHGHSGKRVSARTVTRRLHLSLIHI